MIERTLMALAAAAAIAAAAAVGVFSAFFALYALIEPRLGAPWAAAIVAVTAAAVVGLAGLVAARKAEGDRHGFSSASAAPEAGLVDTVMQIIRERPLLSAGAAVAAGLYALRNPSLAVTVLRAFMDKPSSSTPPGPKGRSGR